MDVIEIFSSLEGEGKRQGKLCTFIRLAGCNLDCSYCDSGYAKDVNNSNKMNIFEIFDMCNQFNNQLITITGGEPLIHQDIQELIDYLLIYGHKINIETNGSVPITKESSNNFFYTMDYKCPTSGEEGSMYHVNLLKLTPYDVLKFVVKNNEDLDTMKNIVEMYKPEAEIYISPVWDKIEMSDIVRYMKENNLQNYRLQMQLHKIIYPMDMRGV